MEKATRVQVIGDKWLLDLLLYVSIQILSDFFHGFSYKDKN